MKRSIFLVILFSTIISCTPKEVQFPFPREASAVSPALREYILESFSKDVDSFRSLRALVDFELSTDKRKEKFSSAYFVERPDKLRLAFFTPGLGSLQSILVVNGEELLYKDTVRNKSKREKVSERTLRRYLFVPLGLEDMLLFQN